MTNYSEKRKINREYKNDLFVFLFGKNREFALSLYNAMNNSNYTDPEKIIFNTIDNFIYIGRQNDVSFLIENTINVYEHQTTINANIALRMFLYVSKLYEKYALENKKDLYSESLIKIPNPNFVVFYFGKEEIEDDRLIFLSEAMDIKDSNLELKVRVINANYGHNQHILNKCPALYEYSWFLQEIRIRYNKTVETDGKYNNIMSDVVDEVIEAMPDDFTIKEMILKHKAEVTDMLYTIEDEPRMMAIHDEAVANKALNKAKTKMIKILVGTGFSIEEATNIIEEEIMEPSQEKQYTEIYKEPTNTLYSFEDEPRMMAIHEEAIANKTREEDKKIVIGILTRKGFSKEDAVKTVEEEFNTLTNN